MILTTLDWLNWDPRSKNPNPTIKSKPKSLYKAIADIEKDKGPIDYSPAMSNGEYIENRLVGLFKAIGGLISCKWVPTPKRVGNALYGPNNVLTQQKINEISRESLIWERND